MMLFPGQLRRFQMTQNPKSAVSITRKYVTTAYRYQELPLPVMNVLAAPQLVPLKHDQDLQHRNLTVKNANTTGAEGGKKTEGGKKENKKDSSHLAKNKIFELGVKFPNKVIGKNMKNKTGHLGVIGAVKPKHLPQLVSVPRKWNLSVSFEDIGDIMKETQFMNKVDPLNLDGPILVSSHNRTANFTYSMPVKFGYCDCFERYCVCCSPLTNKRLHLNSTACSNFTFISKTHELDLRFYIDGKPIHKAIISADKSPMLCLGSSPKVADICVHFFNMTFRVNEHNSAQTQLLGCTDLSLNLYDRTIGAFPVDCFQIPGDPNKVHKERKFNMIFNWVP
ncbi:hypothetical protein ACOMHN_059043 [Nucella lapillus]